MGGRSGFLLYHLLNYRLVLIFIFRRLFELANHLCRVPGNKNALRFLLDSGKGNQNLFYILLSWENGMNVYLRMLRSERFQEVQQVVSFVFM